MEDLYNIIKQYNSDNLTIKYEDNTIYLYTKTSYSDKLLEALNEYGKTHHLRLQRIYTINDDINIDKLFIAHYVTNKKRPYKFLIYS